MPIPKNFDFQCVTLCDRKLSVAYYYGKQAPREFFEFRRKVFVDDLGWHLTITDGMELDEFDGSSTTYCAVKSRGDIVGCWRVLPTTERYLLGDIFPQLLEGPPPRHEDVIEVSRFGIDRQSREAPTIMLLLLGSLFSYAEKQGISRIVAVSDPVFDRVLRRYRVHSKIHRKPQFVGAGANGCVFGIAGELTLAKQDQSLIDYYIELADAATEIPMSLSGAPQ